MSQMKKSLKLIEEKSGLGKRLLRPLAELNISGRRRDKQMALAKSLIFLILLLQEGAHFVKRN